MLLHVRRCLAGRTRVVGLASRERVSVVAQVISPSRPCHGPRKYRGRGRELFLPQKVSRKIIDAKKYLWFYQRYFTLVSLCGERHHSSPPVEISARILHHALPVITSIRILTARILTIRKLPQHFAQSSDPPASTHKRFYSLWPLWYIQPSCVPPLRRHRRMVKEEPPPIHHYPVRIPFYSGGTDGIDVTPIAARHTTGFILRPA